MLIQPAKRTSPCSRSLNHSSHPNSCIVLPCLFSPAQVIDLGDDMSFSTLPEGSAADKLTCSDPTIPSDGSNLVIKVGGQKASSARLNFAATS